ncbi:MAG: hypothetical protein ACRDQX_12445 [Pseudonocardiaceae bacterium]
MNVLGVAGEDAVAGARDQHQRGVNRILGTLLADQDPGRPPRLIVDSADIDAPKQPRLAPLGVTPHLG